MSNYPFKFGLLKCCGQDINWAGLLNSWDIILSCFSDGQTNHGKVPKLPQTYLYSNFLLLIGNWKTATVLLLEWQSRFYYTLSQFLEYLVTATYSMFDSVNCLYCTFLPPSTVFHSRKLQGLFLLHPSASVTSCKTSTRKLQETRLVITAVTLFNLQTSQETRWPTFSMMEILSTGLHCIPSRTQASFYSGSPNTEHRHESHTARPVSSLNTHRHTQRASYKNIQVSPSLADGCYYGNTVTNRECVRACLHQWAGTQQRSISHDSRDVYHLAEVHFCMVAMFTANNCAW